MKTIICITTVLISICSKAQVTQNLSIGGHVFQSELNYNTENIINMRFCAEIINGQRIDSCTNFSEDFNFKDQGVSDFYNLYIKMFENAAKQLYKDSGSYTNNPDLKNFSTLAYDQLKKSIIENLAKNKKEVINTDEGETVNKKEQIIVKPKTIECTSNLKFDLSATSYPVAEKDSFNIITNTSGGKKVITLSQDIGIEEFKRNVNQLFQDTCTSAKKDSSLVAFYIEMKVRLDAKKTEDDYTEKLKSANKEVQKIQTDINSRIDKLGAEKDPAALLELNSEIVVDGSCYSTPQHQQVNYLQISPRLSLLKVDSVVIRVFNNTIHQIDVVGTINGKKVQTISNNDYGIGLRSLIDGGNLITFYDAYGYKHKLCFNKLFLIRPTSEDAISYTLKDGVYRFINKPDSNRQILMQKRLLDFISASAFLDLQAFNAENPNKNLLTELYFNFNINNSRVKWILNVTPLRYLYTNITLGANIFKEANTMETFRNKELVHKDSIKIDTATIAPFYRDNSSYTTNYYIKNFDLIKYSFLQIKPILNLFSIDLKRANTFIELNAGALLTGSNASFINPEKGKDSIVNRPIYSYGAIGEARFRINPKMRYGVDAHFLYCFGLNPLLQEVKPITGSFELETLVRSKMTNENKRDFLQAELNFFFNPRESSSNTDRGGLYFKLNMFKSLHYNDGHFMFLIGYSTDIKNFFK